MVATKQTANGELEVHVSYSERCNHVYAKKGIYLGLGLYDWNEFRNEIIMPMMTDREQQAENLDEQYEFEVWQAQKET